MVLFLGGVADEVDLRRVINSDMIVEYHMIDVGISGISFFCSCL